MEFLNSSGVLAVAAIIPAVVLLVMVYRADKVEHEPIGLLVKLLAFGLISTAGAAILETILEYPVNALFPNETSMPNLIITYFLVVALSEEGLKYLMTKWGTWKNKNFNCTFDGVVYAVFSALAFALIENVGYVFMYGFGNAIVRAITAVPGHCCFGVFMGVYYGLAKKMSVNGNEKASKHYRVMAVVVPTIVHGFYDFLASVDWDFSFLLFIVFVIGMFFVAKKLLKKAQLADEYLVTEEEEPSFEEYGFEGDGFTAVTPIEEQGENAIAGTKPVLQQPAAPSVEIKERPAFDYQKYIK